MLLENKNAVIYGGGGAVGAAVAKVFAAQGAKVFLAGRNIESLKMTADAITASNGLVEISVVDALDREQVQLHLESIITKTGCIDISFNAIGLEDNQGDLLVDMELIGFTTPVMTAIQTHFITTTAAIRHMKAKGSGVILALTANVGRQPFARIGGFGVACAAIESYCRQLALEVGGYGIRVVCVRSSGSPDTKGVSDVFDMHAQNEGITREAFEATFAERTMLKRLPAIAEVANAFALMASGMASAITGAVINVTCGELAD